MKNLIKLAMGVAIAGALVQTLSRRASRQRQDARAPLPSAEGPIPSAPVEDLDDSAGTPLSASAVMEGRTADGL